MHSTRPILFCSKLEESEVFNEILQLADHIIILYDTFDKFVNISKEVDQTIMVRVR